MDINEKVGDILFRARVDRGVQQGTAARAIGISRHTLINIEYGRNAVSFENVVKLAGILGLSFADFDKYFNDEKGFYAAKFNKCDAYDS